MKNSTIQFFILVISSITFFSLTSIHAAPCTVSANFNGDTLLCAGNTATYITKKETGIDYEWTVTSGNIISGQGTDSLIVSWPYSCKGSIKDNVNSCSDSSMQIVIVNVSSAEINNPLSYVLL